MAKDFRIVFMGTPDFAVASLDALLKADFNVVAVITAPDKPAGRGQKLNKSAVKKYALSKNLPILQPTNLKDEKFLEELTGFKADLQVVVAFRMLPEAVWNMPPKGTINLHASLLPKYRGAAPINWAIINGEKESGVSTFLLQHQIDTGNIILQETVAIEENETAGQLHDKLMLVGADLLTKTVQQIQNGSAKPIPQEDNVTHAPKIFKNDCQVDWHKDHEDVHNFIRGLSPYPTAFSILVDENKNKTPVKLFKTLKADKNLKPGEIFISEDKKHLYVGCKTKSIELLELQLAGKKRLPSEAILNGNNITSNCKFI